MYACINMYMYACIFVVFLHQPQHWMTVTTYADDCYYIFRLQNIY
jgi:hypothetical protein